MLKRQSKTPDRSSAEWQATLKLVAVGVPAVVWLARPLHSKIGGRTEQVIVSDPEPG